MLERDVVSAERVHIAFFGMRNAGKSSVVNAVTGQNLSVVSPVKGTTTDPVRKTMELLPIGPVVIIDTPGIDDEGVLGRERVRRTLSVLNQCDVAVLVVDATRGLGARDEALLDSFRKKGVGFLVVYNKADLLSSLPEAGEGEIYVSATEKTNIKALKEKLGALFARAESEKPLVSDLVEPRDTVVLVVPVDSSAPKGRLILPQQRVIRELLARGAHSLVTGEKEVGDALSSLKESPALVITDSQVFGPVSAVVPPSVPLTSFSILFARYKGDLERQVRGAAALGKLKDGERVLISEGCTHHRQCEDIGTVKLPGWINAFTGKKLSYDFTSGGEFPEDLSRYALVVHCGACMLSEREMKARIRHAVDEGVPITNYGIAIAFMHGILRRSLAPFPSISALLS